MSNPVFRFGLLTFGLALVIAAALWWLGLDPLLAWLLAITLITFLAYGFDKAIAGSRRTRVPERILLALTLAGGTLGAFVGMRLFHHKTAKASFQRWFWLIAIVQIVLIVAYFTIRFRAGQTA